MDENNIQLLREDLTEEYHTLAKSYTAAIERLLEEFNDDQMLFRLEAEAYEEERLATMANRAPTTDEAEPTATTITTEGRQEGSSPADTNPTPDPHTCPSRYQQTTTNAKPRLQPHSAKKPPSPTLSLAY